MASFVEERNVNARIRHCTITAWNWPQYSLYYLLIPRQPLVITVTLYISTVCLNPHVVLMICAQPVLSSKVPSFIEEKSLVVHMYFSSCSVQYCELDSFCRPTGDTTTDTSSAPKKHKAPTLQEKVELLKKCRRQYWLMLAPTDTSSGKVVER